jgi:hypothetical protein
LRESNERRAAILMGVIKAWLTAKQADPGEMDPADVERMAGWIAQQEG